MLKHIPGFIMVTFAIIGSTILAMNADYSKYGYIFFLISSFFGVVEGYNNKVKSLLLMSFYFTVINMIGVYKWII